MRHPVRTVSTSICRRARRTLMQDEVSSADSVTNGRPIHNRNPEAGNPRQCWLWLGERSRAQQRKTAAERREVLRNGVVWRCSAHEATGRNRANTGAQGKKIPTDKGWDFGFWWSWREFPAATCVTSEKAWTVAPSRPLLPDHFVRTAVQVRKTELNFCKAVLISLSLHKGTWPNGGSNC